MRESWRSKSSPGCFFARNGSLIFGQPKSSCSSTLPQPEPGGANPPGWKHSFFQCHTLVYRCLPQLCLIGSTKTTGVTAMRPMFVPRSYNENCFRSLKNPYPVPRNLACANEFPISPEKAFLIQRSTLILNLRAGIVHLKRKQC